MNRAISRQGLGVAAGNMLLALTYVLFLASHLQGFAATPRLSLICLVVAESLCLIFALIRTDPNATWHSWSTWATTLAGTFMPLLLRPTGAPDDLLAGQAIQVAGLLLQIAALGALNRSFGLLPAHRGVKTDGLYRAVRHPLYMAYALAGIGYVVNNFDLHNLAVLVVGTGFQVLRILNEETFLLRYPDYADYARRTRWRLLPLIW